MRGGRWIFSVVIAVFVSSCDSSLPEPDSPAAQLYRQRCSTCHRLHAPQTLTAEMWGYMVDRMEQEMLRRRVPPLQADEKQTILEYLQKHANK